MITWRDYYDSATYIAASNRLLRENGIAQGNRTLQTIYSNDTDIFDDFSLYAPPTPYDFNVQPNPYVINPAANNRFLVQPIGGGLGMSGFLQLQFAIPNGAGVNTCTYAAGIMHSDLDVSCWFWDTVGAANKYYELSMFGAGTTIGIRREFVPNTFIAATYLWYLGAIGAPFQIGKALPTGQPHWIGFRMRYNSTTDLYDLFILDMIVDSDWVLVGSAPSGVNQFDQFRMEWGETAAAGGLTEYCDLLNIRTNIDYIVAPAPFTGMLFDLQTTNMGQAGTGIKWNELSFTQLNNEEGTDKSCRFDIYNVTDAVTAASGLIDSPTDLSKYVPDSKIINVTSIFNNSIGQDSPKLSLLEVTYFEPPTIDTTSSITGQTAPIPAWQSTVAVGQPILVDIDSTVGQPVVGQPAVADPETEVIEYYIDWGDGSNTGWADNKIVPKVYDSNVGSPYTMTVRTRDTDGTESLPITCSITVVDVDPVAIPRVTPAAGTTGITLFTADLSESFTPNTQYIAGDWEYDWGDGTVDAFGAGNINIMTHTYLVAGRYKARFRVRDNDPGPRTSPWEEVYVIVSDPPVPVVKDIRHLGNMITCTKIAITNVADLVKEKVLNDSWLKYEDLDDKERFLTFDLHLAELTGQQERDNWINYFENRTLLQIQWQVTDWAGNPDIRTFTGHVISAPLNIATDSVSQTMTITMEREA